MQQQSKSKTNLASQQLKSSTCRIKTNSTTSSSRRAAATATSGQKIISRSRSRSQSISNSISNSKTRLTKSRSRRRRKISEQSRRRRPLIKTKASHQVVSHQEPPTKCSSYVALPKSARHQRRGLFISPAFSKLHARLKVSSNLGRNYSVVNLMVAGPADQSPRATFGRTVLTLTASLLAFTALSLGVAFGVLSEGRTLSWPGALTSLALTSALTLLLSALAYWTSFDLTALFTGPVLLLLGLALLTAAVAYGADGSSPPAAKTAFDGVVAACVLFLLALTVQMIAGGEGRRWAIPRERYIRAAVALYAEIMALYFYLPGVRLVK